MNVTKLLVITWLLTGCATQEIRCDSKLVPINIPGAASSALRQGLPPQLAPDVIAPGPATFETAVAPR
jgi:hypothetical protein